MIGSDKNSTRIDIAAIAYQSLKSFSPDYSALRAQLLKKTIIPVFPDFLCATLHFQV